MAYRKTRKVIEQYARMREARKRKLSDKDVDYPAILPELRRVIVITDYDTGYTVEHRIELYKTGRIDQYKVVIDGVLWKKRIGFSGVLEGIRKSMPRVSSFN